MEFLLKFLLALAFGIAVFAALELDSNILWATAAYTLGAILIFHD